MHESKNIAFITSFEFPNHLYRKCFSLCFCFVLFLFSPLELVDSHTFVLNTDTIVSFCGGGGKMEYLMKSEILITILESMCNNFISKHFYLQQYCLS